MPREAEKKKDDTVEELLEKDKDFTVLALPRPIYGTSLYLAFSPPLPQERIPHLLAAHKNMHAVAFMRGSGAMIQHLTDVEGYSHTTVMMLSPYIFVLVFYNRYDFNGYRYIAQAVSGIDNSGFYTPGFGAKGEVDRVMRQDGIKQEIADAKNAIRAQVKDGK